MVIKTKSVEFMPFFLSFFLFLNGCVWSVYSLLDKDFFIGVPNAIGFVLGSAQLIVYVIYKNKSKLEKPTENEDEDEEKIEEGSAHLVKGTIEMGTYKDSQERNLAKGWSLPKPTHSRQHSFQKIVKTNSLDITTWSIEDEDDVKNPNDRHHIHN